MTTGRTFRIAVCGPGQATPDEETVAVELGRQIATAGCVLVCGGLGGAMGAACRGAKGAGGFTIGILPGYAATDANPWVDYPICTGLGQARNTVVVATADAVIAAGGGFGTLSEIALALRLQRPVVLLGGWASVLDSPAGRQAVARHGGALRFAATPAEAVALARALGHRSS